MENTSVDEQAIYAAFQERQWREWEARCTCCGACCGVAEGDPCEHLAQGENGRYLCRIYENRFGLHKTVSGKPFHCVPIRDILHKNWPGEHQCAYKKFK
jgi:hypothetical protein